MRGCGRRFNAGFWNFTLVPELMVTDNFWITDADSKA
jgi:hypothetical protein